MNEKMISCADYAREEKKKISETSKQKNYRLDIFQIGDNPASNAYIRGKMKDCEEVGIHAILHKFDDDITQEDLEMKIDAVSFDTNGVVLQLPVPVQIDPKEAIRVAAFAEDDVDGMYHQMYLPCTARGVIDWLEYNRVQMDGNRAVVIGRSEIAGKPIAEELLRRNMTVTICHSHTDKETIEYLCKKADIVVVAVGKPHWFDVDCNESVVIDVGISRVDGKLLGDVCPSIKAKYITPVPGGVGLLTRLALLKNIIEE